MMFLDVSAADDHAAVAAPPAEGARQRLRADLGALCLLAHEDAIDRLVDAYRVQRPNRAHVRETYRSLRRLRRAEHDVAARFVADALDGGAPEALLRGYADGLDTLTLHRDIREALLRAMQGRLREEWPATRRAWCGREASSRDGEPDAAAATTAAAVPAVPLPPAAASIAQDDARRGEPEAVDLLPAADAPARRHVEAWRAVARAIEHECSRGMPALVRALLRGPWSQAMAAAALRGGVASSEFRHACGIASALGDAFAGWETLAAPGPSDSQRAMHALASIAVDLRAGLERAGYRPREIVTLWQQLTRLIVQVRCEDTSPAAVPLHGPDLDTALRVLASLGGMSPPDALRLGQSVDWIVPEREPQRLKLCWRSAVTGWHVFVNAAGVKTLELPATRIARLLAEGALVPRDM